jgi:hypothetical protein
MGYEERCKCKCSRKLFPPDRRNRGRQHYCSAPVCRVASKAASAQARQSPENQQPVNRADAGAAVAPSSIHDPFKTRITPLDTYLK